MTNASNRLLESDIAPETAGFAANKLQTLTDRLRNDVEDGLISGAVTLVARNSQLAYFEAVGFAERRTQRPMRRDSLFRIASMTKPLTAVAALMLQERGLLLLGDPVWKFIPQLRNLQVCVETVDAADGARRLRTEAVRGVMSIQDLMRHTAGFTYGEFGDSLLQRQYRDARLLEPFQSNAELIDKLAALPLACQPGTMFEYGMSTDVLGRVIEVAANMPLDRFLQEHILAPLGLHDTTYELSAEHKLRLAVPHREQSPKPKTVQAPVTRPRWASGGGGLISTAADYARFCQMLLNSGTLEGARLLSRKSVELMTHNHLPADLKYGSQTAELGLGAPRPSSGQGFGLGVGVRTHTGLSSAPGSVGDYSWSGITGTYFWVDPAENLLCVFMLQEPETQRRVRYQSLIRALVYQALR